MASCVGFDMVDVRDALDHMRYEVIENYGDCAYGHYLHTWDDGKRLLARYKNCGGYILIQRSEYHSITGDDGYYTDYFPVGSPRDADALNREFNGFGIESRFTRRYLMETNGQWHWSNK